MVKRKQSCHGCRLTVQVRFPKLRAYTPPRGKVTLSSSSPRQRNYTGGGCQNAVLKTVAGNTLPSAHTSCTMWPTFVAAGQGPQNMVFLLICFQGSSRAVAPWSWSHSLGAVLQPQIRTPSRNVDLVAAPASVICIKAAARNDHLQPPISLLAIMRAFNCKVYEV